MVPWIRTTETGWYQSLPVGRLRPGAAQSVVPLPALRADWPSSSSRGAVTVGRHPTSELPVPPARRTGRSSTHPRPILFMSPLRPLARGGPLQPGTGNFVNNTARHRSPPGAGKSGSASGYGGPEVGCFATRRSFHPQCGWMGRVVAGHKGGAPASGSPSGESGRFPKDADRSEQLRVQLTRRPRSSGWIAAGFPPPSVLLAHWLLTAALEPGPGAAPGTAGKDGGSRLEGLLRLPRPPDPAEPPPRPGGGGLTEARPPAASESPLPPFAVRASLRPPQELPRRPGPGKILRRPRPRPSPRPRPRSRCKDPVQDPAQDPAQTPARTRCRTPVQAARVGGGTVPGHP